MSPGEVGTGLATAESSLLLMCIYIYICSLPPTTRKNAHFAHLSITVIRQRLRKSKNPKIQKSKNAKNPKIKKKKSKIP